METPDPSHQPVRKAAGVLLVVGAIVVLVADILPFTFPGNAMIYALPYSEWPAIIGANSALWGWTGALFIVGALVSVFGALLLADALQRRGDHLYTRIAAFAVLFGALLFILELAFRVSSAAWAQDAVTNPATLDLFVRISEWLRVTYIAYSALTLVSFAAYGASLLSTGMVPRWAGLVSVGYALVGLGYVAVTADVPPFTHYLVYMLFGVLLLLPGRAALAPGRAHNTLAPTAGGKV